MECFAQGGKGGSALRLVERPIVRGHRFAGSYSYLIHWQSQTPQSLENRGKVQPPRKQGALPLDARRYE